MTRKTRKRIMIVGSISLILILIVFLIAPYTISAILYNTVFGQRYTTNDNFRFYLNDFDGLQATKYEFPSNDRQTLVGYRYYIENTQPQGVVVMAHGLGGGGHNGNMDAAYYFAQNGYDVFAYDVTGNDESAGDGVNGIPQGVIDLSYAIDFVSQVDELKDLPIMLWGHSWGAYSVSAVLNFHPEVKAVAAISGFNLPSDLIKAQGIQMFGGIVNALMPYVNSIEHIKFGKYASATAMNGFANTEAGIFIAHSRDDEVVPIEYGYDIYYAEYAENTRFKFVEYQDKGHNNILYSYEGIQYFKEFSKAGNEYFSGKEPSEEEISEYYKYHLDRAKYCTTLDEELFGNIVTFFNSYL